MSEVAHPEGEGERGEIGTEARWGNDPVRPYHALRSRLLGYPLLVLLLSLFALGPMLRGGYWWGAHDARHSVYFLFEFDRAIQDGILWPRWAPDFAFGYGYPFFNIYGPFSSYVGEAFHLLGFDFVTSVKLSFALSVLVSGLTMYGFARRLWGPNGGLIAAVAYVYFPYHLADVYVRAALAECWALAWFPAVFWGFYECVTRPRPRAVALTAIAYALLFVSHNGLAVPLTLVLGMWVLVMLVMGEGGRGKKISASSAVDRRAVLSKILAPLTAGLLGITLAGIFVFPWLLEYGYVNTDQWLKGYFAFPDHFVQPWQLLSPFWGFGVSEPQGKVDGFPFQLGLVPLLFAVGAWVLPGGVRGVRGFFTGLLLVLVFLMLPPSLPVWQSPLGDLVLKPMQFPWRLLVLAGLALATLAGAVGRRAPGWVAVLLALVLVLGSYDFTHAEIREPAEGPVGFAGLMRFQQSAAELTGQSRWVALADIPQWSPLADVWVSGGEVASRFDFQAGIQAGNPVSRSHLEIVEVKSDTPRTLRWMITDYPGWHAYRLALDSDTILEELPITRQPRTAHLTVQAPSGHFRYMVRFEDTPVRVAGKVASLLSLVVVGALLVRRRRKGEKRRLLRAVVPLQSKTAASAAVHLSSVQSKIENRKSKILNPWAVAALLLSLLAWYALLSPLYFTGAHDGRHSLFYQLEFLQGVADGHWFPRWGPDFGFGRGYPFFIFYAPFSSYIVQGAKAWGIGLVASVKVAWALGFIVGAAGMFRLARGWWRDERAAFVAALVFSFVPYKFVDIFVRAALAEFWSLALFPWLLLAFHRAIHRPSPRPVAAAALLYAALILCHVGTALLFSVLLGVAIGFELALVGYRQRERGREGERGRNGNAQLATGSTSSHQLPRSNLQSLIANLQSPLLAVTAALALGVLNATIFWLPLLAEQGWIDVTQYIPANYNFANQFTEWAQFLAPMWGFGYAVAGPNDGMSFQLGLLPVALGLLAAWLLGRRAFGQVAAARVIWSGVSLLVVLVAMTALTQPIWQAFPLAAMVQFPWRLLGLTAVLGALLAGGAVAGLLRRVPVAGHGVHPALVVVALLVLLASAPYTLPRFTPPSDREETLATLLDFQREYRDMAGRLTCSAVIAQSSPMEAQYDAGLPPQKFRVLSGTATIEQTYYGGSTVRATVTVAQPAEVELMTYDYPGWALWVDGQRWPHRTLSPECTIAFALPPGSHTLVARFEDTPLRRIAGGTSLLGVALTLALIVRRTPRR